MEIQQQRKPDLNKGKLVKNMFKKLNDDHFMRAYEILMEQSRVYWQKEQNSKGFKVFKGAIQNELEKKRKCIEEYLEKIFKQVMPESIDAFVALFEEFCCSQSAAAEEQMEQQQHKCIWMKCKNPEAKKARNRNSIFREFQFHGTAWQLRSFLFVVIKLIPAGPLTCCNLAGKLVALRECDVLLGDATVTCIQPHHYGIDKNPGSKPQKRRKRRQMPESNDDDEGQLAPSLVEQQILPYNKIGPSPHLVSDGSAHVTEEEIMNENAILPQINLKRIVGGYNEQTPYAAVSNIDQYSERVEKNMLVHRQQQQQHQPLSLAQLDQLREANQQLEELEEHQRFLRFHEFVVNLQKMVLRFKIEYIHQGMALPFDQKYPDVQTFMQKIENYYLDWENYGKQWRPIYRHQHTPCNEMCQAGRETNEADRPLPTEEQMRKFNMLFVDIAFLVAMLFRDKTLNDATLIQLFSFLLGRDKCIMLERPYNRQCKCGFGKAAEFNALNEEHIVHALGNFMRQMDWLPRFKPANGMVCPKGRVVNLDLLKTVVFKTHMNIYHTLTEHAHNLCRHFGLEPFKTSVCPCSPNVGHFNGSSTHKLCNWMIENRVMLTQEILNGHYSSYCPKMRLQCCQELLLYFQKTTHKFREVRVPNLNKCYFVYCGSIKDSGASLYFGYPFGPVVAGASSFSSFTNRRYFEFIAIANLKHQVDTNQLQQFYHREYVDYLLPITEEAAIAERFCYQPDVSQNQHQNASQYGQMNWQQHQQLEAAEAAAAITSVTNATADGIPALINYEYEMPSTSGIFSIAAPIVYGKQIAEGGPHNRI